LESGKREGDQSGQRANIFRFSYAPLGKVIFTSGQPWANTGQPCWSLLARARANIRGRREMPESLLCHTLSLSLISLSYMHVGPCWPVEKPTRIGASPRNGFTMSAQLALKGFGPYAGDPFRFTWHNTRVGAEVWIEYRGRWREGTVANRGRRYVEVEIAARGGRRFRARKSYGELRRRR
jgi:hypothetical protein